MVQLPPILYLIAERSDGSHSYEQIASEVTQQVHRGLEPEDIHLLTEQKLRPLGVLAGADGSSPKIEKTDPLLALRMRTRVVPRRVVEGIAAAFKPLFVPLVILTLVAALIGTDAWMFFVHGVAQGVRALLYQPLYMVLTFSLIIVAAAFHESGHAAACKYGGATPGVMGVGIYLVWPAFYTDVTDAYRLGKRGRLRTDLGGVYFNGLFILVTYGVFFLTGFEPLLLLIFIQHMEMVRQLLPILRFDGYYVLSDVTGVPDLFGRIGAILKSVLPWNWRKQDPRVHQLKPWVRVVVTLWVLILVPFLAFNFIVILTYAPRILATGWDSFWLKWEQTTHAFGAGQVLAGAAGVIQLIALALPALGMVYSFGRMGTRVTTKAWTATRGKPVARTGVAVALAGVIALLGYVWWPDGDYAPVQPHEKWTIPEAIAAVGNALGGRAFPDTEAGTAPGGALSPVTGGSADPSEGSVDTDPTASPSPDATGLSPSPSVAPTSTVPEPTPIETSTTTGSTSGGGVTTIEPSPSTSPLEAPTP